MIEFPRLPDPLGATGSDEGAPAEEGSSAFAEMLQRSLGRNLAPGFASRAPSRETDGEPPMGGDGDGGSDPGRPGGAGALGSGIVALGAATAASVPVDAGVPERHTGTEPTVADGSGSVAPGPEMPRVSLGSAPSLPVPATSIPAAGSTQADATVVETTQADPGTPPAAEPAPAHTDDPDEVVTVATMVSGYVAMGELATVTPIRAPGDVPDVGFGAGAGVDGAIDAPSASAPAAVAQSDPLVRPDAADGAGEGGVVSERAVGPAGPADVPSAEPGPVVSAIPSTSASAGDEALARLRARLGRHDVRRGGDAPPPSVAIGEPSGDGRTHAARPTQPTAPRPVPASGPASALAARIVEIADLVEARKLPQRVIIDMPELDDVRLAVTVRGTTVTITAPGRTELPGAVRAWIPALDAALAERGLDLGGGERRRDTGPGEHRPGRSVGGARARSGGKTDDDLRL